MVCEIYVLWVGQAATEMEQLVPAKKQSGLWPAFCPYASVWVKQIKTVIKVNHLRLDRLFSSIFSIYAKIGWWLHCQVVA